MMVIHVNPNALCPCEVKIALRNRAIVLDLRLLIINPFTTSSCIRNHAWLLIIPPCRSGGMADAPDSKSGRGNPVWVQVPPPAPTNLSKHSSLLFPIANQRVGG